jgi:hypothetical protein
MVETLEKKKSIPRTSIPKSYVYYQWIINQLEKRKLNYFDFCEQSGKTKYETDQEFESIVTRLSKEKYKYMIDTAENAQKEFNVLFILQT